MTPRREERTPGTTGRAAERPLSRRPFTQVHNWADLVRDLAAHPPPDLVLADVDPAVAGWKAGGPALRQGFLRIEAPILEALPAHATLVWTTNATRVDDDNNDPPHNTDAGARVLLAAGKPRLGVLRRALPKLLEQPELVIVIVGDQWLTDGVLARRLNARFVWWNDPRPSPWWANAQQLAGLATIRPLYRRPSRPQEH